MNDDEKAKVYVEMWKQTVTVQQHFNDICWRIRGLALTALTFTLGAAAVAARESVTIRVVGVDARLASVLALVGLVLWLAFYFVDYVWYHQLLIGAVIHGEVLETELASSLPKTGLTKAITASSHYPVTVLGRNLFVLHSRGKLRVFYGSIAALLLAFAIVLQLGAPSSATQDATTDGPTTNSPAPTASASP